jgi:hypothetical protein
MDKLIAFNLYVRTPAGSYHTAVIGDDAKDVYLASDVNALLTKIRGEITHNSGLRTEFQDFNDALAAIDSVLMVSVTK